MGAGKNVVSTGINTELPPPNVYILSLHSNPEAGVTPTDFTGTGTYEAGAEVDIKAEPNPGYSFSHWSAPAGTFEGANEAETTFTMPAENVTVTANFTATPTFTDVIPAMQFYPYIEAMYAEGITTGL